jgi:hypothetical protein
MDYKNKYLKYKIKYLTLKQTQKGGFLEDLPPEVLRHMGEYDIIPELRGVSRATHKTTSDTYFETNVFDMNGVTNYSSLPDEFKNKVKKIKNVNSLNGLNQLSNLTELWFGSDFNQPIGQNVLPNSLTHLEFGKNFNQSIGQNVLPNSLIHLQFHEESQFNQPILVVILINQLVQVYFQIH